MCLADANIVLRYVLNDHPELSSQPSDILEYNDVVLPIEVVCEVVYVLQKVYSVTRKEIMMKLCDLLDNYLIAVEKPDILKQALSIYCTKNIDIVDALLCAYHRVEQRKIFTFDNKLQKCLDST